MSSSPEALLLGIIGILTAQVSFSVQDSEYFKAIDVEKWCTDRGSTPGISLAFNIHGTVPAVILQMFPGSLITPCSITVRTKDTKYLSVVVEELDMQHSRNMDECLSITGHPKTNGTIFCGSWSMNPSTSTSVPSQRAVLSNEGYALVRIPNVRYSDSFRVVLSAVKERGYSGACPSTGKPCDSTRDKSLCYQRGLQCDEHYNCGPTQNGDEADCDGYAAQGGTNYKLLLTIGLGLVCVAAVTVCYVINRKGDKRNTGNDGGEAGTSNGDERASLRFSNVFGQFQQQVPPTPPPRFSKLDQPPTYEEAIRASKENLDEDD